MKDFTKEAIVAFFKQEIATIESMIQTADEQGLHRTVDVCTGQHAQLTWMLKEIEENYQ